MDIPSRERNFVDQYVEWYVRSLCADADLMLASSHRWPCLLTGADEEVLAFSLEGVGANEAVSLKTRRVIVQVSFSSADFKGKCDAEITKCYLQRCPLFLPDSDVAISALQGLDGDTCANPHLSPRTPHRLPPASEVHPRSRRVIGLAVRAMLLELPLLLIFFVHSALQTMDYVNRNYLTKQLEAMEFTNARREAEITYYNRPCEAADMTTRDGSDLFLSSDSTPEDAYEHQLRHGFTVFRNTLRPETITMLRNYIISRNTNLLNEEAFNVLESEHRVSFGLGTDEPIVAEAVAELVSHSLLRSSLEKILGPDPALIELTSITATYGAVGQHYHEDVSSEASSMWYARSFAPSFSLFVPLQNTTAAMGATGACPGSHYCSSDGADLLWEQEGFQLIDPAVGHWPAGDALLMSQNAFHRGAAHTDPDGPDRVLFILTFVPKSRAPHEARLLGQGSTFSLNWDEWGRTLNDISSADTTTRHPWKALRALGLFKPKAAAWGIDYITGCAMRLVNRDSGFFPWTFHDYKASGGLKWLPSFLEGEPTIDDDPWHEYYEDTLRRCYRFWRNLRRLAVGIYLAAYMGIGTFHECSRRVVAPDAVAASVRLGIVWLAASTMSRSLQSLVDQSSWAKGITSGMQYTNVFENQLAFGIGMPGATTLPTKLDVLIETRYGSEYLGLVDDFVNGHPGNRHFRSQVKATAHQYGLYPSSFQDATAKFILSGIQLNGGRFLYQGSQGDWHVLDESDATRHIKRELTTNSNRHTAVLMNGSRRILSTYMYGPYRRTVLAQKHAVPYQRWLESTMAQISKFVEPRLITIAPSHHSTSFFPRRKLLLLPMATASPTTRTPFPTFVDAVESKEGDWISAGDVVEYLASRHWHYGHLLAVAANGTYSVWNPVTEQLVHSSRGSIRRVPEFRPDEELVYTVDPAEYHLCTITTANGDGTYDIYLEFLGWHVTGVPRGAIGRRNDTWRSIDFA